MPIPVVLMPVVAKLASALIGFIDPATREKSWNLYLGKRNQKAKDYAKYLVDSAKDLSEVLNKLVKKPKFRELLEVLGAEDKAKFYKEKKDVKGYAEKLFKVL